MKTKFKFYTISLLLFLGLNEVKSQWMTVGTNMHNTNTGFVSVGVSPAATLLHVGKNMTEPTIRIHNLGGTGGAAFQMLDSASGADWKFKATINGGFKIRDNANLLDVIVVEPNSSANMLYLNDEGNLGIGTPSPHPSALVEMADNTRGLLMPRMNLASRPSLPVKGLIYYQTNSEQGFYYYDGADWQKIGKASEDFWTPNLSGIYYSAGKVAIGSNSPDDNGLLVRNSSNNGKAAVKGVYSDGLFANGMLGVGNLDNPIGLPLALPYIGVLGIKQENEISGAAVYGWNRDIHTGANYGGVFIANGQGTGTNYAIYGAANGATENFAGYFNGKVKVTSTLQVGTKLIPDGYTASVDGKIACEEVFIALSADWPDYVFNDNYPLLSMDEFEKSIKENNHLPGMMPAAEVTENKGYLIGDFQQKTLEKVEELSLYIIELNNRVKILEKENRELKKQLSE